jgi:hypothetical protein
MVSGCPAVLDHLLSIPLPDAIEGLGREGIFLRDRRPYGEERELGGGR